MTPSMALSTRGEIRLMRVEAVPEIAAGDGIPGPIGALGVEKDDPRSGIFLVVIRPDVKVTRGRAGLGAARPLEPGVPIGRVIDDELGDDADAARMRGVDEMAQVCDGSVVGMDGAIIADVVTVIEPGGRIKRQQPDRRGAEIGNVVELGNEAREVADAVLVRIEERFDVQLIDDRVLVPQVILGGCVEPGEPNVHDAFSGSGATRQMANGSSAGSRRTRCSLPVQMKRAPRIRSSTEADPSSEMPHSHSGSSNIASCGWCGSRLTATRIKSRRDGSALP